jgi:hypothetical protein
MRAPEVGERGRGGVKYKPEGAVIHRWEGRERERVLAI